MSVTQCSFAHSQELKIYPKQKRKVYGPVASELQKVEGLSVFNSGAKFYNQRPEK